VGVGTREGVCFGYAQLWPERTGSQLTPSWLRSKAPGSPQPNVAKNHPSPHVIPRAAPGSFRSLAVDVATAPRTSDSAASARAGLHRVARHTAGAARRFSVTRSVVRAARGNLPRTAAPQRRDKTNRQERTQALLPAPPSQTPHRQCRLHSERSSGCQHDLLAEEDWIGHPKRESPGVHGHESPRAVARTAGSAPTSRHGVYQMGELYARS
jgi:hypothetical protein